MILLLSNKWDITVDFVVNELRKRRLDFLRINTEDIAERGVATYLPEFKIQLQTKNSFIDLTKGISTVWCRRLGKIYDDIPKADRPSVGVQQFVTDQWASWIESLDLIQGITWVNHPTNADLFENKIRQLKLAYEHGFLTPKTLITNDPEAVRDWLKTTNAPIISKALFSPLIEEENHDSFIFTNKIETFNHSDDDALRISPCIFQQALLPKIDYRVTVIGERVFAVKIERESGLDVPVDWRTGKDDLLFIPTDLPNEITAMCRSYVKSAGLIFGAIDLVLSNGKFYFLEINPSGEWGWLQKPVGLPIAEALCDLFEDSEKSCEFFK